MVSTKNLDKLRARYEKLRVKLARVDLIQVGTITQRMDRRRSPKAPGGWIQRGPYYQWTWKEQGKTRTRNLSAGQARRWAKAIRNHRELQKIILAMREVSFRILQEIAPKPQGAMPTKQHREHPKPGKHINN